MAGVNAEVSCESECAKGNANAAPTTVLAAAGCRSKAILVSMVLCIFLFFLMGHLRVAVFVFMCVCGCMTLFMAQL